jgi:hypothetical protein
VLAVISLARSAEIKRRFRSRTGVGVKLAESRHAVRAGRHRATVFHNIDGPAIRHNDLMSEHHHPLTPTELLSYMRAQPWAIEASVTPQGAPQAAVIGVAVTDRWELLFDTVIQSRKHQNLLKNPRVAFVIGWEHERTVQYEGIAEIPTEAELPDVRAYYFDRFLDGPTRQTWPGLVYWRVRPTWVRYSNLNVNPTIIQEWDAAAIAAAVGA